MIDLEKDIERAKNVLNGIRVSYEDRNYFTPAYINTNEYVPEYLDNFKLNKGNVLTVLGSGDQALYSMLKGAKNIDSFDINQCSYYFFMLKLAAIKSLSREDFMNYFPVTKEEKDSYFDKELYKKVREKLIGINRFFWDTMYNNNFDKKYYNMKKNSEVLNERDGVYYSSDNYNILKNKIDICNFKFYHNDLFKLPREIKLNKDYYDGIFLSNIFDYSLTSCDSYVNFLDETIKPLLKDDGTCLAWYGFKADSDRFKKDLICKHVYSEGKKVAGIRLIRKNN